VKFVRLPQAAARCSGQRMQWVRHLQAAVASVLVVVSQSASLAANTTPVDAPAAAETRRPAAAGTHPQARVSGKAQYDKGSLDQGLKPRTNSDRARALLSRPFANPRTALAVRQRAAATRVGAPRFAATPANAPRAAPARVDATRVAAAVRAATAPSVYSGRGATNPLQGRMVLSGRPQPSPGAAASMLTGSAPHAALPLAHTSASKPGMPAGTDMHGYARLDGRASVKAGGAAALGGTWMPRRKF
jgi:hypothetical protein